MEDRCIMCGDIVPEGKQVCNNCFYKYNIPKDCNSCKTNKKCNSFYMWLGCLYHKIFKK